MQPKDNGQVNMILLDMDEYAERYGEKAVRKNVTIIRRLIIESETTTLCTSIHVYICIRMMNYQNFSLVFYKASGFVNSNTKTKVIQGLIPFLILKIKSQLFKSMERK